MSPFLKGFATELIKLATEAQQPPEPISPTDQSIGATMNKTMGARAKTELKQPTYPATPQAPRVGAPFPVTTPNPMAGF